MAVYNPRCRAVWATDKLMRPGGREPRRLKIMPNANRITPQRYVSGQEVSDFCIFRMIFRIRDIFI